MTLGPTVFRLTESVITSRGKLRAEKGYSKTKEAHGAGRIARRGGRKSGPVSKFNPRSASLSSSVIVTT